MTVQDSAPESSIRSEANLGGIVAGESARREYERRRAKDAIGRRRALPIAAALVVFVAAVAYFVGEKVWPGNGTTVAMLAGVIAALKMAVELAPRQSTTAWRTGADGESAVAAVLDGLAKNGWRALHDRRVPGKRSNIDHVAVGPSGVWTVDAKRYKGKLTVHRSGVVKVAGRDVTKLLDQARDQAAVAAIALAGDAPVPVVEPVLCFVGTELPRRHTVVGGVHLVTRKGLVRLLTRSPKVLTEDEVERAAEVLDRAMVPA